MLWLYSRPWSGPTNLPTRVASAPCHLSYGDAAVPQTMEGLTRPPTTQCPLRRMGSRCVLFGKPHCVIPGSHCWLWGGGGCEALQTPCGARLEGGPREVNPQI